MVIKPLREDLKKFISAHNLKKKWQKAELLLNLGFNHPSLNIELLEPKWRGIYSFRLDKKYRALFFINENEIEVFAITNHYKK